MVWEYMIYGQKGPMIILPKSSMNGPNYVKWILEPHLKYFYEKARKESGSDDIEVMEDNASYRNAKFSNAAHNTLLIPKIPWPLKSPDLNPIKNLWHIIKAQINQRDPSIRSERDLQKALQKEWDRLTNTDFDHLIISIKRRLHSALRLEVDLHTIELGVPGLLICLIYLRWILGQAIPVDVGVT